jgi:membrane protease YdiL (CAAX protease family)
MVNKKALGIFLGLTFGLTLTLLLIACSIGWTLFDAPMAMSQMLIGAAMFIPALSALITQKWVLRRSLKELGFQWGGAAYYWKTYLVMLLLFTVNYALTWIFIQKPDLTLSSFLTQYGIQGGLPMPANQMIALLALVTLVGAPVMNMIPSLGEEIGWRGFLLPALEPLGQTKAAVFSGMIWALWHTPMILLLGFGYGRQAFPGFLLHFVLIFSLGIWMPMSGSKPAARSWRLSCTRSSTRMPMGSAA